MRRTALAAFAVAVSGSLMVSAAAFGRSPAGVIDLDVPAKSLDDATIVAIFDAANTADIETGQLAAERGHSKEVREFGAMLVRDHKMVRQTGRDLAKKLGVTPLRLKTPPAPERMRKPWPPFARRAARRSTTLFSSTKLPFTRASSTPLARRFFRQSGMRSSRRSS